MPRKGRGGARQGTPGTNYGNRSDLGVNRKPPTQGIAVASGQPYGQRSQQIAAQQAIPLPAAPPVQAPSSLGAPQSTAPVPGMPPQAQGPFDRPTDHPNEPLTAGLPVGPGPGPEAIRGGTALSSDDVVLAQLRAVMRQYPSSDIARLIEYYDKGGTNNAAMPTPPGVPPMTPGA